MGKVLQIRVSAQTYAPDAVYKHWPGLSRLAWGQREYAAKTGVGVRELVAKLNDLWKFGNDWPPETQKALGQALPELLELNEKLENALAERQPSDADKLTYALEDGLDGLERSIQ